MDTWKNVLFESLPLTLALIAFFLSLRTRIDRLEVRVESAEAADARHAAALKEKSDRHECDTMHGQLDLRLAAIEATTRATFAAIVRLLPPAERPLPRHDDDGSYGL